MSSTSNNKIESKEPRLVWIEGWAGTVLVLVHANGRKSSPLFTQYIVFIIYITDHCTGHDRYWHCWQIQNTLILSPTHHWVLLYSLRLNPHFKCPFWMIISLFLSLYPSDNGCPVHRAHQLRWKARSVTAPRSALWSPVWIDIVILSHLRHLRHAVGG